MTRRWTVLLAAPVLILTSVAGGPAAAQSTLTVNDDAQGAGPPGAACDAPSHSTIQAAVTAAAPGDTILVCAGTYAGNVTVSQANLTLRGAQAGNDARVGRTDPAAESVVSGGTGSAVTVAGPSGVTIDGFRFTGSGVTPVSMRGGSGHTVVNSVFTDNTGQHAIIYGTDGTLPSTFARNRITNQYHGIFGSTAMHDVTITQNEFFGHTYSPVHFSSPTNGPGAGSNVTVSDNVNVAPRGSSFVAGTGVTGLTVTGNSSTGSGIDLLGSFAGVRITDNTIIGSNVGVQLRQVYGTKLTDVAIRDNDFTSPFGSVVSVLGGTDGVAITGNSISGSPFSAVRLTNNFGPGNENVAVVGNTLTGNAHGVRVSVTGLVGPMDVRSNRISGNTVAGVLNESTLPVGAENNWWGCNAGPGAPGCDVATGPVDSDPWLVLGASASPNPVTTGSDSTVTANLTGNSAGEVVGSGAVPDGTPVTFSTDRGTVSPASATTVDGRAATTFTAGASPGTATVAATVDQQTESVPVVVAEPDLDAPDTTIVSGPSGTTTSSRAVFSFTSSEAASTFECSLDGAAFTACSSPLEYAGLSEGRHAFEVRARDTAGNVDPTPAAGTWTVDTVAPVTSDVSPADGATGVAAATDVAVTFSEPMDAGTVDGSSLTLVRQGAAAAVAAEVSYDAVARTATLDPVSRLEPGAGYTAVIEGGEPGGVRDAAGNVLASDETWAFTVATDVHPNACTIDGDEGDDVLTGTPGPDVICGWGGNDVLSGFGGSDTLRGGTGDDVLVGGSGRDSLLGQDGADSLRGNADEDLLFGGGGADEMLGDSGNDELRGGDDRDTLRGDDGDDVLYGNAAADALYGDDGNDTLFGGPGDDDLDGGEGDDELHDGRGEG